MPQKFFFKAALLSLSALCILQSRPAAASDNPGVSSVETQGSAQENEDKKEIEKLLNSFERDWNAHNIEAVMSYYADDYYNNDGYDKKTIRKMTEDLWKSYPDLKSYSQIKQIRIEGPYATVQSKDEAAGSSSSEMPGLGTRGELKSVSEGQLYIKRIGGRWRITGDRLDFEKIKLGYGLGRQIDPTFGTPQQVRAGKQFTARLELELPPGLAATGSISQSPISFPPPEAIDKFKAIGDPMTEHPVLERVMTANTKNRNEILKATIALTNASGNSIMGIVMLTRRLSVVPIMEEESRSETATATEKPHPETSSSSETRKQ